MKGLNENEPNESDEPSSESEESIHHIKKIKKIDETNKHFTTTLKINGVIQFRGKIPVNVEYENNKQKIEILITERTDMTPLLGMDWMKNSN